MGHGSFKHKGDLLKDLVGLFARSPEKEGQMYKIGKPVSQPKSRSSASLVTSSASLILDTAGSPCKAPCSLLFVQNWVLLVLMVVLMSLWVGMGHFPLSVF